ncbi:MAG: hypothetical protein ACJ77K_12455 [Bacteroidia bacterium]
MKIRVGGSLFLDENQKALAGADFWTVLFRFILLPGSKDAAFLDSCPDLNFIFQFAIF